MDGIVNDFIRQGVALSIMAVVISTVVLVATIGQRMGWEFTKQVDQAFAYAYDADFENLVMHEGDLPAPTVFVILEKNRGSIHSISGIVDGIVISTIEDLVDVFHMKIETTVTESSPGVFEVLIQGGH